MGWNDAYWQGKQKRAEKANAHHQKMLDKYKDEISRSVEGTAIWDSDKARMATGYDMVEKALGETKLNSPEIIVDNLDTVSGLMKYHSGKTVVLNFASYKNPGGGFLTGSSAQEEALCHESTLYEVISDNAFVRYYEWNNENKNKALYKNRALWSPEIIFEKDGQTITADVLTVAAPNRKAYMDYMKDASEEENLKALQLRTQFVADLIKIHACDTAILGAFGCGVFGQDPETVARLFKKAMADSGIKIVYAVIDKGGHTKEGAYAIFSRVMKEETRKA